MAGRLCRSARFTTDFLSDGACPERSEGNAALGRFTGVDPVSEAAESLTTYQYAMNSPVMFNDPLGDQPQPITATYGGMHGGYGRIGPGSGYHWSDHLAINDRPQPGPYQALWNSVLDYVNQGGTTVRLSQRNGEWGFWGETIGTSYENNEKESLNTVELTSKWYKAAGQHWNSFIGGKAWNAINNYMTGIGMAVDGAGYQLGRVLDKRLLYEFSKSNHQVWKTPVGSTNIKLPAGSININTNFVKGLAKGLKIGSGTLGAAGILMTGSEILSGEKKLVGEGGLDLFMGGVAFIPGGGWIASGLYFGGKYLLEETGNDFWNK